MRGYLVLERSADVELLVAVVVSEGGLGAVSVVECLEVLVIVLLTRTYMRRTLDLINRLEVALGRMDTKVVAVAVALEEALEAHLRVNLANRLWLGM